jgi:hypothetical protein
MPRQNNKSVTNADNLVKDIRNSMMSGPPRLFSAVSLLLFVATGAFWLIQHFKTWPAGYWPWILSLAFLSLVISSFLAFNDVRLQRNSAYKELAERFDSLRYRFTMIGLDGGPADGQLKGDAAPSPGYTFTALFKNGGIEVMQYEVDWFSITMQDGSATSSDHRWESKGSIILPGETVKFFLPFIKVPNVPLQVGVGEYAITYWHPSELDSPRFKTHHKFSIAWDGRSGGRPQARWTTQGDVTHEPE